MGAAAGTGTGGKATRGVPRRTRAVAAVAAIAVGFGGAAVIDTLLLPAPAIAEAGDYGPGDGLTRLVVSVPGGADDTAVVTLSALPGVESAQRLHDGSALVAGDGITPAAVTAALPTATVTPAVPGEVTAETVTDPGWAAYGWNLRNTGSNSYSQTGVAGADVDAPSGWGASTGRGLVVAIVDSGFDMHPDMAGALWTNPDEPCGSTDVDGNGKAGDCHGWNFYKNTADVTNAGLDNSHGTSVSYVAAARRNDLGSAGVAPDVTIMPLVIGAGREVWLNLGAEAIRYAADHGADVINASWGGLGGETMLREAIQYAVSKGAVVVAAAGNDGRDRDAEKFYPASINVPGMLTVGNTTAADRPSSSSAWGANTVDLYAPGTLVYTGVPGGAYTLVSGTSIAAPQVAAAAALYRDVYPDATAAELAARLVGDAEVLPSLAGKANSSARLSMTALGDTVVGVRYAFTGMSAEPGSVTAQIVASGSAAAGEYAVTFALGMEHDGQVYALTEVPVTLDGGTGTTGDDGSVTFDLGHRDALGSLPLSPSVPLETGRYVLTAQLFLDGEPLGREYAAPLLVGVEGADPTGPDGGSQPSNPTRPGGDSQPGRTPAPGEQRPGNPTQPGGDSQPGNPTQPGGGSQPGRTPAPGEQQPGTQPGAIPAPGEQRPGNPTQPGGGSQPGRTPAPGEQQPGTQPGAIPAPGEQQPGTTPTPGEQQPGDTTPIPGQQPPPTQQPGGEKTYPGTGTFGLTSIDPTRVTTSGGTEVTITGTAIPAGARVRVGDAARAAVTSVSATQLTFTTPARVAGVYDVHVFAPDGTEAVLAAGLTYVEVDSGTTPMPGDQQPGSDPGGQRPGTTPAPGNQPGGGSNPATPRSGVIGPNGERLLYSARFASLGSAIWSVNCSSTCSGLAV
ncbi:S8 family serine peptidase [Geodermatophilus ruber]|uniref:IPT/TIG domain-containing protein n=1 Tax=Geodermatophilus ruber TaxID=504800 RepID=A0A1I4F8J6_9ACTN|nr:S8 family serine peptidase [Geodermatophilus ruber]SFL14224.1 IPT/TIG domain-containing protein [Geodermatophilus ruber]